MFGRFPANVIVERVHFLNAIPYDFAALSPFTGALHFSIGLSHGHGWVPCLLPAHIFLLCGFYSFVSFLPTSFTLHCVSFNSFYGSRIPSCCFSAFLPTLFQQQSLIGASSHLTCCVLL